MRLHVEPPRLQSALAAAERTLELPEAASRHLQVLRVQPGDAVECFDGQGRAWAAVVQRMDRRRVWLRLGEQAPPRPGLELRWPVTLAVVMPANDRMDFLVEKATELGVAFLQPLVAGRSVLRLAGERAERKVAHWQGVAQAAAEQCGRRVLPRIEPVLALDAWLGGLAPLPGGARWVLHPPAGREGVVAGSWPAATGPETVLSGPEGGLAPAEVEAARRAGFTALGLGERILRADTAPLAFLAARGAAVWQIEAAGPAGPRYR